ncbi:ABC transporter ATP-binding protein [Paenibacillus taiwanensis]|uniref:ABC transporter ATP-binding protein n=1 Tax=Paenibacillus taiwanensis TaxID=401638 RepID=UPI00040B8A2F|nr:ABC transporter ATP-binding protein [Paenibacillus taiwanensis]
MLLALKNISKQYNKHVVFSQIDFSCDTGKVIAIKGKSGVGKSTMLNILAGLERPTSGQYIYQNKQMEHRSYNFLTKFRSSTIGYISQFSPMIPELTVLENISVPLWFEKEEDQKQQYMKQIEALSYLFEIEHLLHQNVKSLSGGQLQRAGIIRALVKNPPLIIADEPTGSLDDETASLILNHFTSLKVNGTTTIIATHNDSVSNHCDETYLLLKEGLVYAQ